MKNFLEINTYSAVHCVASWTCAYMAAKRNTTQRINALGRMLVSYKSKIPFHNSHFVTNPVIHTADSKGNKYILFEKVILPME